MTTPVLLTNPNVEHRFGRPLAVLSLVCSLAHIPLFSTHFTSAPVVAAVMAVLALACIPCARRLWAAPTTHDCVVAAALAAAMVGLHLILALSMSADEYDVPAGLSAHVHHPIGSAGVQSPDPMAATAIHQHMPMHPVVAILFYTATALAVLQIVFNVAAVLSTVAAEKTDQP